MPAWIFRQNGRLRLALKVSPRSRRNGVKGVEIGVDGRAMLKVEVTAAPEDGKANAAVVRFLAKRWRVAAGRFELVSGRTARQKVMEIKDGDDGLLDRIETIEETESKRAGSGRT